MDILGKLERFGGVNISAEKADSANISGDPGSSGGGFPDRGFKECSRCGRLDIPAFHPGSTRMECDDEIFLIRLQDEDDGAGN